jgi:hypothetical protein
VHISFADSGELDDDQLGLVALVPHQSQASGGSEDASALGQGQGRVEPVEGLGHGDGVERAIDEPQVLSPASTWGVPRRTSAKVFCVAADGSDATTAAPAATRIPVSLPVPAATSSTRVVGPMASACGAWSMASSG